MTAADEIRLRGWRQCSIAADPLRERLLQDELLRDATADDLLIVATQDCDLVCHSFETEPYVEIVIGRHVESLDGNCRFGKNPRRLQFELSGTSDTYEVQAISRISIPRDLLAEYAPDPERNLDSVTSRTIPEWLGKRYTRAALPDTFNERSRSAQAKIRDRLKSDGELVEAIFVTVVPNAELPSNEPYSLVVRVVAREETLLDETFEARLVKLSARMTDLFRKCEGITLIDCAVVSDEEFTFADMSRSVEWDVYDDLSNRPEAGGAVD